MRVVIQRVSKANVLIDGSITRSIGQGLMILLGIETGDNTDDVNQLCAKIPKLRIFNDDAGIMNLSLIEINGEVLLISQFTLHASTKKGNRPSYLKASKAEIAIPLYEKFIVQLARDLGKIIYTGEFGADMKVALINDGPVTICIDTKNRE